MKEEYNFDKGKRGPIISPKGKSRITIYIDNEVLEEFRERADAVGYGYQTMINEALREYLQKTGAPVNESVLRQVIREELERVTHS